MKRFLQNFWSVADLLSYVFLIAGVAVRELGNDDTFNMPRRLYAFSLVLMYAVFESVSYSQNHWNHSFNNQRNGIYFKCLRYR